MELVRTQGAGIFSISWSDGVLCLSQISETNLLSIKDVGTWRSTSYLSEAKYAIVDGILYLVGNLHTLDEIGSGLLGNDDVLLSEEEFIRFTEKYFIGPSAYKKTSSDKRRGLMGPRVIETVYCIPARNYMKKSTSVMYYTVSNFKIME